MNIIRCIKGYARRVSNRIYDSIGNIIIRANYKVIEGNNFSYIKSPTGIDFIKDMHYADERDPLIQHMFGLYNLKGTILHKYSLEKNLIRISAKQTNNENWIVFMIDSVPNQFSFEFDYMQSSSYCEFQIAFNYESLLNRNRFIVMENRDVLFDDISTGHFFTPLKSKYQSSRIFENGAINHVEIICSKKNYEMYVNGVRVMSVSVKNRLHRHNGLAIILWENYNNRSINACFSNFKISKLEEK